MISCRRPLSPIARRADRILLVRADSLTNRSPQWGSLEERPFAVEPSQLVRAMVGEHDPGAGGKVGDGPRGEDLVGPGQIDDPRRGECGPTRMARRGCGLAGPAFTGHCPTSVGVRR
jgi:hypothetical protein